MTKTLNRSSRLCLALVLIVSLTPKVARADDGKDRPVRLHATAASGPVGTLYSLGAVTVNGRLAYGEQMIWGGELLQAHEDASAHVRLDSIGQIVLLHGAIVRLATTTTNLDDNKKHSLMIASLISGDLVVKLEPDAGACIETGEWVFTSSIGASFRLGIREGHAVVDAATGAVKVEPQRRPIAKARDVNAPPNGPVVEIAKTPVKIKPKKSIREQQQQWQLYFQKTNNQAISFTPRLVGVHNPTTQTDTVTFIADRTVRFKIVDANGAPSTLGSILDSSGVVTDVIKTDSQGVVTYTFQASSKQGSGEILADIEPDHSQDPPNTDYQTYHRRFRIKTFWTTQNKLLIVAAAVGAVVYVICCGPGRGREPLRQVPPPMIP